MKQFVILSIFFVFGTAGVAQKGAYYTKDGVVAEGYDVIAYFDGDAQKGSAQFVSSYDGVNFHFVSAKNKEKFDANPSQYVPQYGGWCAYAVAKNNSKVSINPETFEIRDGKLYLFYNALFTNTLKSWLKEDPEKLKVLADENWPSLR